MATQDLFGGRIQPVDIQDEIQRSYLDYAMSVIVGRALPDVRDGLKPVHRRILWSMLEAGLRPDRPHRKSANVVGQVMAKYHPHGDQAIYDALARMAQTWSLRAPLIDGHGNFGSPEGDPPAAMRYCVTGDTMVRLADGSSIRIDEFVDAAKPNSDTEIDMKVLDRRGDPVRATKFFHSGRHATRRITTGEGYSLTGTLNHPVLCLVSVSGVPMLLWKLLSEVDPGDRVALLRRPASELGTLSDSDRQLALLAGAWVSEGWASEARAGFNNVDGRRSRDKVVPSFVWRGGREFKALFLRSLFEGDGSSGLGRRSSIVITYSTRSDQLARGVQQLLLELGVVSRISRRRPNGEIQVLITNRRDARLFARNVGFLGVKQSRLEAQLAFVPSASTAMSSDHVPFVAEYIRAEGATRWIDREWLRKHNIDRIERWERDRDQILSHVSNDEVRRVVDPLIDGTYYFAKVATVEEAGNQAVYSVRVDSDDHAFISNGFVSHNTESRLAPMAMEVLRDIDAETVDFVPNYDGYEQEPVVLPARFPNLLVNGAGGIAVGMATNIPPHNLGEVIDAVVAQIDDPEITVAKLMKHVKGPDFPTGATIVGRLGIKDAYETGRGSIKMRGVATIEETRQGGQRIVITEVPYQVNPASLLTKIAELRKDGKIKEIATDSAAKQSIRNESGKQGMRLIVELRRGANPHVVLNQLYKHTQLQESFGVIMLSIVDGVPLVLNLKEMLQHYIAHQSDVVTRRTKYQLRKAEERDHIVQGLLIALQNLDAVIKIIRGSQDAEEARTKLMSRFKLSEIQANHILDMPLRRLTRLARAELEDEHKELLARIKYLQGLLKDPKKIFGVIKEELAEIRKKFADPRRTQLVADEGDLDIEDLIATEDVIITISRGGYVKRVPVETYRRQGRGGRGVRGAALKEEDVIKHVFTTTTHHWMLFFTSKGKVYRVKVHSIPEGSRTARGLFAANLPGVVVSADEKVNAVIDLKDYEEGKFLVFATRKGMVKRTPLTEYDSPRTGLAAINLHEGDELVEVLLTDGKGDLMLISRGGLAARFSQSAARPMG
ncbi:MAG: DNA gyrase subunit A, partial [Actinomycetota bacterium]